MLLRAGSPVGPRPEPDADGGGLVDAGPHAGRSVRRDAGCVTPSMPAAGGRAAAGHTGARREPRCRRTHRLIEPPTKSRAAAHPVTAGFPRGAATNRENSPRAPASYDVS